MQLSRKAARQPRRPADAAWTWLLPAAAPTAVAASAGIAWPPPPVRLSVAQRQTAALCRPSGQQQQQQLPAVPHGHALHNAAAPAEAAAAEEEDAVAAAAH